MADAGELISRARTRANISETDTQFTPATLLRLLNSALRDVALEHDWPWLFTSAPLTIVAGTNSYALPAGWMRTLDLVDTSSGQALVRKSAKYLDTVINTGQPSVYAVYGTSILIAPNPTTNDSYTHRFIQTEPVLTSGTSVPLIPEAFSEVVVDRAAMKIMMVAGDGQGAQGVSIDYVAGLKRMAHHLNTSRDTQGVYIRPGSWF